MRNRLIRRLASLAVPVTLLAAGAAAPVAGAAACPAGARCATLTVPADHSGATPGSQPVAYTLLPATGARTGTLAVLVGGPGQAATSLAPQLGEMLAPIRASYDLLLVDQRGTGGSGPVSCPSLRTGMSLAAVTKCGEDLGARRATLTTREDAADLEDVRAALGIDRLSLLGISYGTEIAGQYARTYTDRTARIVLDSPEPIEGPDAFARLRQVALPRVLREVCATPSCRRALGTPIDGVARLAARLARGSLRGVVIGSSGRPRRARFTSTELYALVAVSDLDPFLRTALPAAVASALRGDTSPVLRLAEGVPSSGGGGDAGVSVARLLATDCIESQLPWDPADGSITDRTHRLVDYLRSQRATFAPFSPADATAFNIAGPCLGWPATPRPQGVASQGPAVPALVVSGREDLRTPLEDAIRTAGQYPGAQLLSVPATGHSVLSTDVTGCALRGVVAFLAGGTAQPCARTARVPGVYPYVPVALRDLASPAGAPKTAGRVATALVATLLDARREAAQLVGGGGVRAGGLRAGTITVSRSAATLRGYSVVRGVALTGTLPFSATKTAHIVVSGRAVTVSGHILVRGSSVVAVLGGRRFVARIAL
jgi:pimeloyl-ACP methyl ester carboxylesterase